MIIYNSSQNTVISEHAFVADNFISRSIGLLNKNKLVENESLIIKPCCSIHTFFMKFDIDVLFINKKNEIIALYENVKPYKILPIHPSAHSVIELPSGTVSRKNISIKDILNIKN